MSGKNNTGKTLQTDKKTIMNQCSRIKSDRFGVGTSSAGFEKKIVVNKFTVCNRNISNR